MISTYQLYFCRFGISDFSLLSARRASRQLGEAEGTTYSISSGEARQELSIHVVIEEGISKNN